MRTSHGRSRGEPSQFDWTVRLLVVLSLILAGATGIEAADAVETADPGLERLQAELRRVEPLTGGTLGIHAIHLETGRTVSVNGEERFPMASTYKVPIAFQLLRRVDRGEIALDSMIHVESHHHHPGSGTLSDLFIQPGVVLSIRNLTELMLLISDNTATDLVLELAGGPGAVTESMDAAGFHDIRVDRPTVRLIADWLGVDRVPEGEAFALEAFQAQVDALSEEMRDQAARAFDQDLRDTATPGDMARLLEAIWTDRGLSAESAALLRDIMDRCRTGEGRIRGLLPDYVNTANKTGTIGGTLNDVGVIELPEGGGTVVVAAFIKGSELPRSRRESAMAHAARAIYDYFVMNP